MNFTIDRETFLDAIREAGKGVKARTTLPILSNLLLKANNKTLSITGADLDTYVTAECHADIIADGCITLPANKLEGIASTAPGKEITIVCDTKKAVAALSYGRGSSKLLGLPADEYPEFTQPQGGSAFSVSPKEMRRALCMTKDFASHEEERGHLNGVHFDLALKGSPVLVATDGRRLSMVKLTIQKGAGKGLKSFTLPNGPARILCARLEEYAEGESEEILTGLITFDDEGKAKHTTFTLPGWKLSCALNQATFPNYKQVIPPPGAREVTFPTIPFLTAIRRVSPLALNGTIICKVDEKSVSVSGITPDVGQGFDDFEVIRKGDTGYFEFRANSDFLTVILSACGSDQCRFFFGEPEKGDPILLQNEGSDYTAVLMPMKPV